MNAIAARPRSTATAMAVVAEEVRLGKDVLELLSTAMYVDPMVVYREYVQNAADALDLARSRCWLGPDEGEISITIDPQGRSVRIRDDGAALTSSEFVTRMVALGASGKRGTRARGFRGVGRLAGLGHAQELIFRSRGEGEDVVNEVRWNGRELRAQMVDPDYAGGLADLVARIVTVDSRPATDGDPERFFEVEMLQVPRGRSDKLLGAEDVADYLAQIAPVPFHPDFRFGSQITEQLKAHSGFSEARLTINGGAPVTRAHRDAVDLGGRMSEFEEPVFVEIPSHDGSSTSAVAWFLHHGYEGALATGTMVKGLRLRVGNLQVGDNAILEGLFTETRFNSWSVGEVHIFDPRLVPNGRRDQFEHNAHYSNLLNRLLPTTRDIANRCRTYSSRRSKLREFDLTVDAVVERVRTISQGGLSDTGKGSALAAAETGIRKLEVVAGSKLLAEERALLASRIEAIKETVVAAATREASGDPLAHLLHDERAFFQRMIDMIYAHSVNQVAAKSLVDRILERELAR